MIRDEDGLLTGYVYLDLSTKDYGGFVDKSRPPPPRKAKSSPGYTYKWSGDIRIRNSAPKSRLKIIVPIVFFVIFLLLYMVFQFATEAASHLPHFHTR